MPIQLQRDHLTVVLVSPRNPLNIGAAARAMANFGFARLAVVAPWEPHWREAKSAVGAEELLQHATVCASLQQAIADCTLVVGTGSLDHRKPEQTVVSLPDFAPLLREELARDSRVALVFGPEKHGLTRDDLAHCHLLVEIPTHPQQPSMNLAQAVAVCLYELSSRLQRFQDGSPPEAQPAAAPEASHPRTPRVPSARLEILAKLIEETMDAARYSPASMSAANRHDLRLLLRRISLTEQDVRRMLGLFRRILWRLRR